VSLSLGWKPFAMRKALTAVATILLLGAIMLCPLAARAQTASQDEVAHANFVKFLNNHPILASEMARDPGLINDPHYLDSRPGLKNFFDNHRVLQKRLQKAPGTITFKDGHYDWITAQATASQSGNYLLEHPDVARAIEANPPLLKNSEYIWAHPGLQAFIDQHPNLSTEMKEHPYGFVSQQGIGYLPPPVPASSP
jgi:hypothetical protein